MDAGQGGTSAFDTWRNDIAGQGSLTKAGSGTLVLTGANTYGRHHGGGRHPRRPRPGFGSGAIRNDASLVLDQAVDGTMANALSAPARSPRSMPAP